MARGTFELGDNVFENVKEHAAAKPEKLKATEARTQQRETVRQSKVSAAKDKPEDKWTIDDYKAMCFHLKQAGDEALEKTIDGLKQQYAVRKARAEAANDLATAISNNDSEEGESNATAFV